MISEQQEFWNTEEQRLVYCRLRLLFAEAGRLYEKHKIGQDDSFNIFSVLLRESDEVNLHSRFLHALLDYKEQKSNKRENLSSFIEHIGIKDFVLEGETVERERFNIDILIRNDKETAVAIENKIYAKDQENQLQRYKETLVRHGYKNIHIVYLTLDGRAPSPDGLGELDKDEIITTSYQNSPEPEKSIRPWLKGCQNRAFDNLELQVAIKQYRSVVQQMLAHRELESYEKEVLELLCQNDNLLVVKNLRKAMDDGYFKLLQNLWREIDSTLKEKIPELKQLEKGKDNEITEARIRKFVTNQSGWGGLFYSFRENAWLSVEIEDAFFCGVTVTNNEKFQEEYEFIKKELKFGESSTWWPARKYVKKELKFRNPTPEVFEMLLNPTNTKNFSCEITEQVRDLWDQIKRADLVQFPQ